MNFVVHSFMYTYYAVQSTGYRVPKAMAQLVTFLQIAQMTFALYTQAQALLLPQCNVPLGLASFGLLMFLTFWALFIKFFADKYFHSTGEKKRPITKGFKKE